MVGVWRAVGEGGQGGSHKESNTTKHNTHNGINYSHLLYCLDLLSSYNKFIIPGNRVSKTLIGPISWEIWG